MLETSIGVTATLLGAMAITGEMGARRRHTHVRTERWFVNAALILLLVLTIAARITGVLTA